MFMTNRHSYKSLITTKVWNTAFIMVCVDGLCRGEDAVSHV